MPSPTLRHFIFQAELLQAYRSAVRATRTLPDPQTRRETLDFLRADFEQLKFECNIKTLESRLSSFRKIVRQMTSSFSLSRVDEKGTKLVGRRFRP
ncbi:hypothetical protein L204_101106 [Cryptococcus depauperatus]|nr:hypothetical protein L204_00964 [Cryptococcus depauperatus CBS 7855]